MTNTKVPIAIAYYLGQFHPLKENNDNWGEGFTEWHNVARARPLFSGHGQPILPGKFGFYDLRHEGTIIEQTEFARAIGVDAFCHWHYWFSGRRVLHRPFESMLNLKNAAAKVCLGWANESWTGIWHGLQSKIIIEQTYGLDELKEHAALLSNYFAHENYLKINDTPLFVIYKPRNIPRVNEYLGILREQVKRRIGREIYIVGNWGPGSKEQINKPADYGLDAVVINNVGRLIKNPVHRSLHLILRSSMRRLGFGPEIRNYKSTVTTLKRAKDFIDGVAHCSVVTGWDNTPRSGPRGLVLQGYDGRSLKYAIDTAINIEMKNDCPILFIKSWNEWAEGNTIEPKFNESWSAADIFAQAMREIRNGQG
jgi:Glycosyltransferase WbsX